MQDLQFDYDLPTDFAYPAGNLTSIITVQDIWLIYLNQRLKGRKNIPYFDINDIELNHHYHSHRILKDGEVVL